MKTLLTFLGLFSLVVRLSKACSCSQLPITLQNALTSGTAENILEVFVLYEVFPEGRGTAPPPLNRYYEAYVKVNHLGCDVTNPIVILKTPPAYNSCSKALTPYTDYLVVSDSIVGSVNGYHNWPGSDVIGLNVHLCDYTRPMQSVTSGDQALLASINNVCPALNCETQPSNCGPYPSAHLGNCPDGSARFYECKPSGNQCVWTASNCRPGTALNCETQPSNCGPYPSAHLGNCLDGTARFYECRVSGSQCQWTPSTCPDICYSNTDCPASTYCASNKQCLNDGRCSNTADCVAPGNNYSYSPMGCLYSLKCLGGTCAPQCLPTSNP